MNKTKRVSLYTVLDMHTFLGVNLDSGGEKNLFSVDCLIFLCVSEYVQNWKYSKWVNIIIVSSLPLLIFTGEHSIKIELKHTAHTHKNKHI